jgi:hypothetical protein
MDRVEVFADICDVPEGAWDGAVPPGRGGLRHAFLAPCERVLEQGRWRVFTVTATGGGAPGVVSPGILHSVDLAAMLPAPAGALAAAVRRLRPGALRARVLELGPPCWPGAPLASRDPAARAAAAERIVEAAWREVTGSAGADALMVRDFAGQAFTPLERRLEATGYALVAERPTFIARVQAPSLDAYLGRMRAPYRRRAQRYLAADLHVTVSEDFADRADEIARLCALTTARATESRRERVDADVVRGWARCRQARAVLLEEGAGRLALAALVLEDAPVLHFIRVGFDDVTGRASGAYPRLLYELCRLAIARGLTFVDFGLTSADPKLRAGALPVPLRVWVRHRNPALQALLRRARPLLVRAEAPPARHVFREPPPPLAAPWYGEGG